MNNAEAKYQNVIPLTRHLNKNISIAIEDMFEIYDYLLEIFHLRNIKNNEEFQELGDGFAEIIESEIKCKIDHQLTSIWQDTERWADGFIDTWKTSANLELKFTVAKLFLNCSSEGLYGKKLRELYSLGKTVSNLFSSYTQTPKYFDAELGVYLLDEDKLVDYYFYLASIAKLLNIYYNKVESVVKKIEGLDKI